MSDTLRQRLLPAALLLALIALLLIRIGSFGIWDPWELNAADAARNLLEGEGVAWNRPPLTTWLISTSFDLFGVNEWAGRLPAVLGGVVVLIATLAYARRFGDRRAGMYAAIIAGTTPLFLFNARQMLGDAVAMGATGLVGLAAAMVALRPPQLAALGLGRSKSKPESSSGAKPGLAQSHGVTESTEEEEVEESESESASESKSASDAKAAEPSAIATWIWPAVLAVAIPLAALAAGALQGLLPPLLAVAAVALFRALPKDRARLIGGTVIAIIAVALTAVVARAVFIDAAGYSPWLGGAPRGGNPPGFDVGLELVFHAFAPWSALALVAVAALLRPDRREAKAEGEGSEASPLTEGRLVLVLWAALAYGAQVVFTSRYGPTTYLAVVPLAAAIALFLRDVEESGRAWWSEAVIGALFIGLLIRDFAFYPSSPISGLPLDGVTVPEIFNPMKRWAVVLGVFALGLILAFISGEEPKKPEVRATVVPWLKKQWKRGGAFRFWLGLGGLASLGMLVFGTVCWIGDTSLPLASLVIRVGQVLMLVPIAAVALVFAVPWALHGARKLGETRWRMAPLLIAGVVVGGYASQGFLPELSAHFSPREVYDTYNELHDVGEPLGEYQVSGRAAAYYAEGEIEELRTQADLLEFLGEDTRRWAVIPTEELPALNRSYRAQEHEHLFVADARSARMLLVTNQPVAGRENQNFLVDAILDEEPDPDVRVGGKFDDRIELIGYDIDTPQQGFVGAGQEVTVTWYWRALNRVPGSYQIFLHVDGMGNRMNGDHEPVEGKYPVRLWDEGDIIVDRQTMRVPANYRPGPYTFWIGFYSGNNRLSVTQGQEDDADRLRAGVMRVR